MSSVGTVRVGLTAMGDGPIGETAAAMQQLTDALGPRAGHLWIAEAYVARDALAQAAIALASTSTARVATGTINVHTRHPALIGMAAATLDEEHPGRFVLGLSVGQPNWMRRLGYTLDHSHADLASTLDLVKRFAEGRSAIAHFGGRASESLTMPHGLRRDVAVVLGTMGPKTLDRAGRRADGALLSFFDDDDEALADLIAHYRTATASPPRVGCVTQCFALASDTPQESRERTVALSERLGAMSPRGQAPVVVDLEQSWVPLADRLRAAGVDEISVVAPAGAARSLVAALIDLVPPGH